MICLNFLLESLQPKIAHRIRHSLAELISAELPDKSGSLGNVVALERDRTEGHRIRVRIKVCSHHVSTNLRFQELAEGVTNIDAQGSISSLVID